MLARYLVLGAIGAVAGTAYDFIHVYYGVLSYARPDFHGTALWLVPGEFGLSAIGGSALVRVLARRLKAPKITLARAGFDAALLLLGYLVTGWFVGNNALTAVCLVPLAAVSVATRPSRFVLAATATAAVLGPMGEIAASAAGVFHYNVASPVPYWLPLLWMIAAGAFIDAPLLLFADA